MSARIFANRKVPWKHMTAGLLGGGAATVAMSQFQNVLQKMTKPAQSPQPEQPEPENEDATVKAAAKLSRLAGYELSRATKKKAAPLVHYGFGTIMGAIYGMAK